MTEGRALDRLQEAVPRACRLIRSKAAAELPDDQASQALRLRVAHLRGAVARVVVGDEAVRRARDAEIRGPRPRVEVIVRGLVIVIHDLGMLDRREGDAAQALLRSRGAIPDRAVERDAD